MKDIGERPRETSLPYLSISRIKATPLSAWARSTMLAQVPVTMTRSPGLRISIWLLTQDDTIVKTRAGRVSHLGLYYCHY